MSLIEITPGIAGGKPRIAGRRITVQNIVIWHERLGWSADEIAVEYGLSPADVRAALVYYQVHREEIERSIREDEAFVAELRRREPSILREKLGRRGDCPAAVEVGGWRAASSSLPNRRRLRAAGQ